jgi:hypothetical protein
MPEELYGAMSARIPLPAFGMPADHTGEFFVGFAIVVPEQTNTQVFV